MAEVIILPGTRVSSLYLLLPVCPHDWVDTVIYSQLGPVGIFHAMTYVGYWLIHSFCKYFLIVYHVPGTVRYVPSLPAQKYHGKHKLMAVVMPPMAFCSFRTSWTSSQAPVESSRPLNPLGARSVMAPNLPTHKVKTSLPVFQDWHHSAAPDKPLPCCTRMPSAS